jgi:alpha-beta hydrolase superfamily lysophospholipase
LSAIGLPVKGLVVYFHGMDQNADVIRESSKHKSLFEPLLRDGYAVVSADARLNAFGNPESREDYRKLIAAAQTKYNVRLSFFVAESMGALPALALLTEDTDRRVRGMVGITPLMGIPPDMRTVNFVAYAWGGKVPERADPMSWPPEVLAGRVFRLYAADGDDVIPAGATAQAFAARFGSAATVETIKCQGGHVDPSCYDGAGVEKWMAGLL